MSTTPEDNNGPENTTTTKEGGQQPTFEPGVATDEAAQDQAHDVEASEHETEEYEEQVPAEPKPGGAFSAETLSIVGLVLVGVTVFSGQLLEMLSLMFMIGGQPVDPQQLAEFQMRIWTGGAVALITVLISTLSLALTNAGTRLWARWAGTAGLIVGLMFLIVAAVAYFLMPEAAEQMMPPIME